MSSGLKPPPFEYQYTEEEQALHNKVLKIAQEVTGRHGDYDGRSACWRRGGGRDRNLKFSLKKRK
jgi:hypothetical protein